jgi:hypothetical protein
MEEYMRPTELAESYFRQAQGSLTRGMLSDKNDSTTTAELAGLVNLMEGLVHLSTGLRATYILLEEVKRLLEQQKFAR